MPSTWRRSDNLPSDSRSNRYSRRGDVDATPFVDASKHSIWLRTHFDFDNETAGSPTVESVAASKAARQPLDLRDNTSYRLSIESGRIRDVVFDGKALANPVDVLERIYKQHVDSVSLLHLQSTWFRLGALLRNLRFRWWDTAIGLLKSLLQSVFGYHVQEPTRDLGWTSPYTWKNVQRHSMDSVELFGYKAAKKSIVIFALVATGSYLAMRHLGLDYSYAKAIFTNPFLTVCGTVACLWFIDDVLPRLLFSSINFCIERRRRSFQR